MIGFEISINGNALSAAIEKGILSLIITRINIDSDNSINLDLTGLDSHEEHYVDWFRMKLKEGDEINLKVKNLDIITPPIDVRKSNDECNLT